MHVGIHVGCVRKILLAPFCTALHMDDFCLFCLIVVHKAWTTSTLLPRCAPIDRHVSMKSKLSICIWTTKALCLALQNSQFAYGLLRLFALQLSVWTVIYKSNTNNIIIDSNNNM